MISKAVKDLVSYGLKTGLLKEEDAVYARNQILDVLRINEYEEPKAEGEEPELEEILRLFWIMRRKGAFRREQRCIQDLLIQSL